MRLAAIASALAIVVCAATFGAIFLQKTSVSPQAPLPAQAAPADRQAPAVTTADAPAMNASGAGATAPMVNAQASPPPAVAPVAAVSSCAGNPNALGISRVVEIDTTGGPGFGLEHFKSHDFLREGEVVLTFDDGPWPKNTPAVLAALAAHCTKAIFFPIGLHATYEPGILKQVAAAGHAIGSHTWCHQICRKPRVSATSTGRSKPSSTTPRTRSRRASVRCWAVGGPTAPYFRFPALRQPQELMDYLGKRNIGIFSADLESFDFKMRKPEQVRQSVMAKLKTHGKGIVLLHDFQHATAEAATDLLNDLKAGGYKVVFMKPKFSVTTIASYDEAILKQVKGSASDSRPTSSVMRTISE